MMKIETPKDIAYYLSLSYTTILRRDDEGDVIARIEELPGCISHGSDEPEALNNLASMKRLWLEDSLAAGEEIPEPQDDEPLPSGKWLQRVPRSLHAKLARMAKAEGVSLNQLVTAMLSEQITPRAIQHAIEQMAGSYVSGEKHRNPAHLWINPYLESSETWRLEGDQSDLARLPSLRMILPGINNKVEHDAKNEKEHATSCR